MKGKEGTGDLGGPDAKSGPYSSGSGLCPSGEKGFFADVSPLNYVVCAIPHVFTMHRLSEVVRPGIRSKLQLLHGGPRGRNQYLISYEV